MSAQGSPVATAALLALCGGLGWAVYGEATQSPPSSVPAAAVGVTAAQADAAADRQRPAYEMPPIETFSEIIERPLFDVSRRPVKAVPSPPITSALELELMLSGIVIDGSVRVAHLKGKKDKRVQHLRVGDRIESWKVEQILPDHVVLRAGSQIEQIFLKKPDKPRVRVSEKASRARKQARPQSGTVPADVPEFLKQAIGGAQPGGKPGGAPQLPDFLQQAIRESAEARAEGSQPPLPEALENALRNLGRPPSTNQAQPRGRRN